VNCTASSNRDPNRQCQACSVGKFKAAAGYGVCSDCPLDSNSAAAAVGYLCNAGFESTSAQSCTACATGKFKGSDGNTLCTPCPTSTFSFVIGSTACRSVTCPVQQFVSTAVSNVARTCGSAENGACVATINSVNAQSPASHGNDGIDTGNLVHSGGVTVGTPIVFTIDFAKEQIIQFIMFHNRNEECCKGHMNGATVRIGQTSAWAASTAYATLNSDIVQTLDCNLQGRYMFIVLPVVTGSEILNFHELKVFSACSNCPERSSSPQGSILSTSCVCNSGSIGQNGGICSECAAGKYTISAQWCTNCLAGKYSSVVALNTESGCTDCSANANHASGNSFSSCVLCDRGNYWVAETSVCTVCAVPKYKTQVGSAACLSCVKDIVFIAADQACTQLTEGCVNGYYYEGLNCLRCKLSTHNHTTPVSPAIYYRDSCLRIAGFQKVSNTVCTACPPGFYSPSINSMCISSPRGTMVQFPGSPSFQKCPRNWVSHTACTPCPFGTYSNIENTLCMPGSENKVTPPIQTEYKIRVFCVGPSSRGFQLPESTLLKISGVSWDVHRQHINQIYPDFVSEKASFATPTCTTAYLHSTPTTCNFNMFMMRIHSYIWECVSCPVGMYKDTQTLLYSDCKPCSDGFCPELEQACDATEGICDLPSNLTYMDHFKYSIPE